MITKNVANTGTGQNPIVISYAAGSSCDPSSIIFGAYKNSDGTGGEITDWMHITNNPSNSSISISVSPNTGSELIGYVLAKIKWSVLYRN